MKSRGYHDITNFFIFIDVLENRLNMIVLDSLDTNHISSEMGEVAVMPHKNTFYTLQKLQSGTITKVSNENFDDQVAPVQERQNISYILQKL